jgi:hypothetical protein
VGLFDPPEVKALKKSALSIGEVVANTYTGITPPGLAHELLYEGSRKADFQRVFQAAATKVGHDKALRIAINEAHWIVTFAADRAHVPRRPGWNAADQAIHDLLG